MADEIFLEEFRRLMKYDLQTLNEIAEEEYGIVLQNATKEELATQCALIEVNNFSH